MCCGEHSLPCEDPYTYGYCCPEDYSCVPTSKDIYGSHGVTCSPPGTTGE